MKPKITSKSILDNPELLGLCAQGVSTIVLISDSTVDQLYGQQVEEYLKASNCRVHRLNFPAGEAHKTRKTKQALEDQMLSLGCSRDTCIVALGGGVTTDLVGFLAATYCRGLPVVYMPTTVMAMVDAAWGGKTGVNTPAGKNMIGSIQEPRAVLVDVQWLETLPEMEFRQGFAEMIKHAMIADAEYFSYLEKHSQALLAGELELLQQAIERSVAIKHSVVQEDRHEQGRRAILNFGHTLGHALERLNDYQLSHGEAVAAGMILESQLAVKEKILKAEDQERLQTLVLAYFPEALSLSQSIDQKRLLEAASSDKKTRQGQLRFVLPKAIGACTKVGDDWVISKNPP